MNSVLEEKKEALIRTLKEFNVKRAAVFGSVARGDFTVRSDIDLLVEFEGRKSLFDLSSLKLALEDLLGRKVDVLTYDSLHPLIKENILKEQEIIL